MGQLVQVVCGKWEKSLSGEWSFQKEGGDLEQSIVARTNEPIHTLESLVRTEFSIPPDTAMVLSYQIPPGILIPNETHTKPKNVTTSHDVEVMMSLHDWMDDFVLCVTHGALDVAKYQFLCRSPFNIGQRRFLGDGVTEEQHMADMLELVSEGEFVCSGSVLREICSEEQLVLVYRVSFEIRKAKDANDAITARLLPEVIPEVGIERRRVVPLQGVHEMFQGPAEGVGVTTGPRRRNPRGVIDIDGSSTGSTEDHGNVQPAVTIIDLDVPFQGNPTHVSPMGIPPPQTDMVPDGSTTTNGGGAVSEIMECTTNLEENYEVITDDDATEVGEINGTTPHDPDSLCVGMVFTSRGAFKHHMAMYAIRNKFTFRNTRSSPGRMILRCISQTCSWRVYAVMLKNTELFEVRTFINQHSCSVDDRSGYQSQATHTVVGGMMRARFAGRGGGPRPNDIMQTMQGDHHVHISYWKAWRSREIALDYAKGASGASYNLLPKYLDSLVHANPGTLADVHTEYIEGVGHKFKYMFLALAASIEGYSCMRKVIVVDGTHLRGKYAGCLLTASAQDGNYQVFPLAVAVVDGENDKSWEWFFQKLTQFIPNSEDVVFVSDRHPSIYCGIAKVYPRGKHCACILHLKRNVRTYFKDKHLGYLVGKAARAYRVSEFYETFNEIKRVNASCAEYLLGIGVEHWARSHFTGDRYNIMTSNVAETWNSVLREAREYPILSLIDYIRTKLMDWFSARRELGAAGGENLTPRVQALVTANFENSGMYEVKSITEGQYEVRGSGGDNFLVDLTNRTCSCYEFQALKIPCTHAIVAATRFKVRVASLVSEWYSLDNYKKAYGNVISPAIGEDRVELLCNLEATTDILVNPPASRRPPGRPRKNRILSRGEYQMKGTRKRTVCSRCKGSGHNRATCKMAI